MLKKTTLLLSTRRHVGQPIPGDFRHHVLTNKRRETEEVMGGYGRIYLFTGGRLEDCFAAIAEHYAFLNRPSNPTAPQNIPLRSITWEPWMIQQIKRVLAAWVPDLPESQIVPAPPMRGAFTAAAEAWVDLKYRELALERGL